MEIGRLKDKTILENILKIYSKKNILVDVLVVEDGFVLVCNNPEKIQEATDVYMTLMNIPKSIPLDKEWVAIKKLPLGQMSLFLMISSTLIYVLTFFPMGEVLYNNLKFQLNFNEIYRVLTPVFLHFGLFHILFNMLWLKDLGSIIEFTYSKILFLALFILAGVISNGLQFIFSGPEFGGMSGVIYGFLGFLWVRSNIGQELVHPLPKRDITLMIIWYFLCLFGLIPKVANWAHGGGLVVGMILGLFLNLDKQKKWSKKHAEFLSMALLVLIITFFVEFFQIKIKY